MTVYYLLYFWLVCMLLLKKEKVVKNVIGNKEVYKSDSFAPCMLLLLMALRHPSMGFDLGYGRYYGYLASFHQISLMSWAEILELKSYLNYEKGYITFNKVISYISNDNQMLIIACAAASLLPVFFLVKKYCENETISLIIYLGLPSYFILFSGLRQGIALGITCISFYYTIEKKPIHFVLSVLLATLFHYTSIVYLIVYPAFYTKIKKRDRWLSFCLICILFCMRYTLFGFLSHLINRNNPIEKNSSYMFLLMYCVVYLFCCVFYKEDKMSNGFLNIVLLTVFSLCFTSVNQIAIRIAYYFMNPIIILLPNILEHIKYQTTKIVFKVIICSSFILFGLYSIYSTNWMQAYPYHFFWQKI